MIDHDGQLDALIAEMLAHPTERYDYERFVIDRAWGSIRHGDWWPRWHLFKRFNPRNNR